MENKVDQTDTVSRAENERTALISCILDKLQGADNQTLRLVYATVKGIME